MIFDDTKGKKPQARIEEIVREFCPPLPPNHPARLEKLLNVLSYQNAVKLYLVLPPMALSSEDLTPRSKLKPFVLDFIDDARKMLQMPRQEIFDTLMSLGQIDKRETNLASFEDKLQGILEQNLKRQRDEERQLMDKQGSIEFEDIKRRFKLYEKQAKLSKRD